LTSEQAIMFIKICGITTEKDYRYISSKNISAAGFVACPKSPRYISPEQTARIISSCKADVENVGVFVNASFENILAYIDAGINIVQLHGDESADLARKLSGFAEVWKALRPETKNELNDFANYPADKFLIDAYCPDLRGGTGKTANWDLARFAVDFFNAPVILAGGLGAQNVKEAISKVRPFGLDASSGVEISPGVKDHSLVDEFIKTVEEACG